MSASRATGASASELPVLWHVERSIFSEKGRWALDYKGITHRRRALVPGTHGLVLRTRRRGSTVPVLDIEGKTVRDSSEIVAELERIQPEPRLYPADASARREALQLEEFFDEHCGHEVRRINLHSMLDNPRLVVDEFLGRRHPLLRTVARAGFPVVAWNARRRYGIDPRTTALAREAVSSAFDCIEARIGPSGYIAGDEFSIADLTAAALLAHLVLPSEYPYRLWDPSRLPADVREFRESQSQRRGFRWVLDMYRHHRGQSAAVT